jgi:hypothetical protein
MSGGEARDRSSRGRAAYAMRSFTRETLRQLWICLATAGLVGCAIMTALAFLNGAVTSRATPECSQDARA